MNCYGFFTSLCDNFNHHEKKYGTLNDKNKKMSGHSSFNLPMLSFACNFFFVPLQLTYCDLNNNELQTFYIAFIRQVIKSLISYQF